MVVDDCDEEQEKKHLLSESPPTSPCHSSESDPRMAWQGMEESTKELLTLSLFLLYLLGSINNPYSDQID